jgi:diguanylate cyclase (GGDEF)-like protein
MTESHSAVRDDLLGSPNRRPMQEAIDGALENLRAGGEPAAVMLVEVGGLAAAGDAALAALLARMTGSLRAQDLVARFGGDVIGVVVAGVTDDTAAHRLAERIEHTLEGPGVSASVGISLLRESDPDAAAVIARADAAMYAAKNKRSRHARGDRDCPPESSRELLVEAAFERSSIEDFEVHYQPVADLRNGSVAAVEALLRWEHPDLETIPPGEFLAVAEQRGQMVTIGRWVIDKACAQTVRWAATRDGQPMRTSVNVSPSQVVEPAFVDDVLTALARHGATGHQLALDLTQATLDAAPAGLLEALAAARIELTIDAAQGIPATERLACLPIAMIKVDRSWTRGGADESLALLREVAELARSLAVPAVVQGVETREQLAMVRDCGFVLAQGHLFSRPQSGPAVEQLVYRERPFASLLAPRPAWFDLADGGDGDGPAIELGTPAVP